MLRRNESSSPGMSCSLRCLDRDLARYGSSRLYFNANWQQEPGKVNSGSRKQTVTTQDSEDLILDSARARANLNGERSPLEAGPKASY